MSDDLVALALEREIPGLRRFAFAMLGDADLADDLVQDCLERALGSWHLRRADGDLRAWLFAILRNLCLTAYRVRRRHGSHIPIEDAPCADVPARQEAGLEIRDILAALDRLPEEQKALLLLIGVEDLSYAEAARVLGIPLGTVMSRLSRARQRLSGLLGAAAQPIPLRRVK